MTNKISFMNDIILLQGSFDESDFEDVEDDIPLINITPRRVLLPSLAPSATSSPQPPTPNFSLTAIIKA